MRGRVGRGLLGWAVMAAGVVVSAQAPPAGDEGVALDALQCWRRIGAHAVYVGERFDMMLTCRVIETDAARAVPDPAWLEPETLAVSPFEVLEGERYRDIARGAQRFFQYRYTLRIIGEDYFGVDVELPALELKYRVERALPGGVRVEGRELTYVLPPESIRVLALVPAASVDIRELPGETFGDAERRLFRANAAGLGAAALGVLAGAALMLAGLRAYRVRRAGAGPVVAEVPAWRVARTAWHELAAVRAASRREGWTAQLVARGLSVYRVAAALAVGQPLVQETAVGASAPGDGAGRLRVTSWVPGSAEALVSSTMTSRRLEAAWEGVQAERPDDDGLVEAVRQGLIAFSGARYAREDGGGAGAAGPDDRLGAQTDAGIEALRALATRTVPPVALARAVRRRWQIWSDRWIR